MRKHWFENIDDPDFTLLEFQSKTIVMSEAIFAYKGKEKAVIQVLKVRNDYHIHIYENINCEKETLKKFQDFLLAIGKSISKQIQLKMLLSEKAPQVNVLINDLDKIEKRDEKNE